MAGLANGTFTASLGSLTLQATGAQYFADPSRFYSQLVFGGNFQSFAPISGSSVQLLNDSGGIQSAAAGHSTRTRDARAARCRNRGHRIRATPTAIARAGFPSRPASAGRFACAARLR